MLNGPESPVGCHCRGSRIRRLRSAPEIAHDSSLVRMRTSPSRVPKASRVSIAEAKNTCVPCRRKSAGWRDCSSVNEIVGEGGYGTGIAKPIGVRSGTFPQRQSATMFSAIRTPQCSSMRFSPLPVAWAVISGAASVATFIVPPKTPRLPPA